jgi:hypothetical protein
MESKMPLSITASCAFAEDHWPRTNFTGPMNERTTISSI